MTVWVIRDGKLVVKGTAAGNISAGVPSELPKPMISRMEPFLSPVTEKEITSWRARDRDMEEAGAFDVRDLGPDHVFAKGRNNGR